MPPCDPKSLALETWDHCRLLLPKHVVEKFVVPKPDPAPMKKKNTDIMRLRVLPRKKAPRQFWNTGWCFYEIGVGVYDGALTVGGVQFVQFPFQQVCGGGKYWRPTICVLEQLKAGRNNAFVLYSATGPKTATVYKRIYHNRDFPFYPVDEAAQDLAWLIRESLPRLETIG